MPDNLHIFNDANGFYANKTVQLIEAIHTGRDFYINTASGCNKRIQEIRYTDLRTCLKEGLPFVPDKVVFHSYGDLNRADIPLLKKHFGDRRPKFAWIFWSHEYYQLPEFFSMLYQGFSRKYYLRKLLSFHAEHFLQFVKGHASSPFYTGLRSLKKTFRSFDLMGALIKDDYHFAMQGVEGVQYAFVSYISLDDFPKIDPGLDLEKHDAMVGHSGSPILNHYEILQQLSQSGFSHPVLVPMAYGKPQYIAELKQKVAANIGNLDITFQTEFIPKEDYYRQVSRIGYFILNSYCQQALGNIFFFLWTGTKVFLRKNTSTYKTLSAQGFHVFSIDDDLDTAHLKPMSLEEKRHNHRLVEEMIGEERVRQSWLHILNF